MTVSKRRRRRMRGRQRAIFANQLRRSIQQAIDFARGVVDESKYRVTYPNDKARAEELLAIADRAAEHVKRPYGDHGGLLYDKNGLPK